jgi:hypothetical protein
LILIQRRSIDHYVGLKIVKQAIAILLFAKIVLRPPNTDSSRQKLIDGCGKAAFAQY